MVPFPVPARPAFLACLLAMWPACTYPTDPVDQRAASGIQTFELVRSRPVAGTLGVSPNSSIDLTFNVPPDADTVAGASFRVFAGLIETPGHLAVDLLDHRIRFTPTQPLRANLRHQVYVHGSLAGLNGAPLQKTVVFNFTTGEDDRLPPPPAPPPVDPTAVQALWDHHCSSCHRPPSPPAGVDLSSSKAALASLRDVPSTYGNRLRVESGSHARSYLMLKLVGIGAFVGFTMPPASPPLQHDDLRRIATWIDGGAP